MGVVVVDDDLRCDKQHEISCCRQFKRSLRKIKLQQKQSTFCGLHWTRSMSAISFLCTCLLCRNLWKYDVSLNPAYGDILAQ